MSPQRRKWRGGGGGKTVAPLPSSSSSSAPAPAPPPSFIPSPSPHIQIKSSSFKDRRHAIALHPIAVPDASFAKPKPQLFPHSSRCPSSSDRSKTLAEKNSIAKPPQESSSRLKARATSAARTRIADEEKSRVSSETGLRATKPRSLSAVKPRPDASGQASRASLGYSSMRTASSASEISSSICVSKRESNARTRTESRPRPGRASSPFVHKEAPEEQASIASRDKQVSRRQVCEEVTRSRAKITSAEEDGEGKDLSTVSRSFNTVKKVATNATRSSTSHKENQGERGSASVMHDVVSVQTNRKSNLAAGMLSDDNSRTKGKQVWPHVVVEGRFSEGSLTVAHSTRSFSKATCQDECKISANPSVTTSLSPRSSKLGSNNASLKHEEYTIDSTVKSASFGGVSEGNEACGSSHSFSGISVESHEIKDACGMSSSLHRRLAHLEGKVSQIAAELRRTRCLLDSDDCSKSVSVLCDIQDTISTIERTMVSADSDDIVSLEDAVMEDEFPTIVRNSEECTNKVINLYSTETGITSKVPPVQGSVSVRAKFSQLNQENQQELEDRLLPHGKLLKNHFSLSNVHAEINLYAENKDASFQACSEQLQLISSRDLASTTADNVNNATSVRSSANSLASARGEGINLFETDAWSSRSSDTHLAPRCVENSKCSLQCDERLPSDCFDEDVENVVPDDGIEFECYDEILPNELHPIGDKVAVAGWYASEGDAILLAHDDGSCSYHDVANMEEKSVFGSANDMTLPVWNDCWLIRAAASDGHVNKYVVAMTAGSATDSGFCSWDFYNATVSACHIEDQRSLQSFASARGSKIHKSLSSDFPSRSTLPLSDYNSRSTWTECDESCQWWYNPNGPLLASAANAKKRVALYDIRDGEVVMEWDTNTDIASLENCYPVQWRDRGKLVLAEREAISVWDVNTMDVNRLQFIELPGKQISALYVHNSDAECSGGVRQRLSSSETEAFDGICCTQDDINVLDFRVPNGVGISFPNLGQISQCVFARQDMVLIGGLDRVANQCSLLQWSVRKATQVCSYTFGSSSSHYASHHLSLTQVWGSSSMVMAVNGNGLSIFKACKESDVEEAKDVVGPQDLCNASFDFSNSQVLLISRDRPAFWSYL